MESNLGGCRQSSGNFDPSALLISISGALQSCIPLWFHNVTSPEIPLSASTQYALLKEALCAASAGLGKISVVKLWKKCVTFMSQEEMELPA